MTTNFELATCDDATLNKLHESLNRNTNRTVIEDRLKVRVDLEVENRIEHEAKFEFSESNAKDIINFLTTNAERKDTKPRLRIQWNVALDVLIDRYPKLASRADDYTKKNPLLDWYRTFYQLVAGDMAGKAGK